MSTTLVVNREQFPKVVPVEAKVGDTISFSVSGVVRRVEADLVDVSSLGGRLSFALGGVDVEVTVTRLERKEAP